MCTGKFTVAGSRWDAASDWRQGGQQESGARTVRSNGGMTEESELDKPYLFIWSVLFSVPKPNQENFQSLMLPVNLGNPVHLHS